MNHHRAIAATFISLGLLAVPATAAHAVREPAPGAVVAGAGDLAPQDPSSDAVGQQAGPEGLCAAAPLQVDLTTTRYRTPFDISNQAARNRSELENLR
jgi:hypothetical protein